MAIKPLSRKALFAAALIEAKTSAPEFAEASGVSNTQLHRTLKDPTNSAPLTAKIDAFILEHVGVSVPEPADAIQEAPRTRAKAS